MVDARAAWRVQPLELRFMLGDWLLASARVPAAYLTTHVSRLGDDPTGHYAMLSELGDRVDALVLPSHPIAGTPQRFARDRHRIVYMPSLHEHHMIALGADMAAYMAARPKKHRHEISRKLRRFVEETGAPVDFRAYRTPGEVEEFFALAAPIARLTYQERLMGVGMPLDGAFREASLAAAEAGNVRAFLLHVSGRPIAFGYCSADGDRLDYQYTGYDPAARDLAPGYVLLTSIIESTIAERRFAHIDLGYGDAQYKRYYATASTRCATIHVYRDTARNRRLVRLHRACNGVSNTAAAALDSLGLKAAIKRLLRG